MITAPRYSAERAMCFGPFRLFPAQRLLLEGETPVSLGSRALEILIALVERPGELVSKRALMARVWSNIVVEEGNLKVHIAMLRKALGDGQPGRRFLATVPGIGYRFVAPVELTEPAEKQAFNPDAAAERSHSLPAPQTRPVGRTQVINTLVKQLPQQRFVTVAGAGGIGKTTVALAVANALIPTYEHGVRFVDLASIGNRELVPSAVASVLGLPIKTGNAIPELIEHLWDMRMLIVLDCCEHVAPTAAVLVEQILSEAPGINILATSREPLRPKGEHVHHLAPLAVPPSAPALTATQALEFSSVQLFVERAAATLSGFELTEAEAPAVAEICRKLEGIPLAIELAANRVNIFGIRQLSELLNDRTRLLRFETRSPVRRHRTLTAALDWSYDFLPEHERVLLRRLSVFSGVFTLNSAGAVASDSNSDVIEGLAGLVVKSLISADVSGTAVQYQLTETTRAYAMQKLVESGELDNYARRHAEHDRLLSEQTLPGGERAPAVNTLRRVRDLSLDYV